MGGLEEVLDTERGNGLLHIVFEMFHASNRFATGLKLVAGYLKKTSESAAFGFGPPVCLVMVSAPLNLANLKIDHCMLYC